MTAIGEVARAFRRTRGWRPKLIAATAVAVVAGSMVAVSTTGASAATVDPDRVVRAGQPQQRQGVGCVRGVHGGRCLHPAVHPVGWAEPAVAVRGLRWWLLPGAGPALGQGAGRVQLVDRRQRGDRAVDRSRRQQPAVPAGRLARRLCPADQPAQQQGVAGAELLDRRRCPGRAVHRQRRQQPAVAVHPGRWSTPTTTSRRRPRRRRPARAPFRRVPLDLDGLAGATRGRGGSRSRTSPTPRTTAGNWSTRRRTTRERRGAR